MKPTVGHAVHYVSYGTPGGEYESECRAAIITETGADDGLPEHLMPGVGLAVLNPTGMFFNRGVRHDEGTPTAIPAAHQCGSRFYRPGSWHWPERVS